MTVPATQYTAFAVVAILTNIGAQDVTIRIYDGPFDVFLSIIVGTATGLLVKYVLDKRYIFRFRARDLSHDTRTFVLYSAMGVVTTAVFWLSEFAFYYVFATDSMRYVGGILGLIVGYSAKYHLDKRYVFRVGVP